MALEKMLSIEKLKCCFQDVCNKWQILNEFADNIT